MSENKDNAANNINARIGEIKNIHRIVQNAFNLISDADIKGAHSPAVSEILGWLAGFGKTLQTQMDTLSATLPKETPTVDAPKTEPVKQEVTA